MKPFPTRFLRRMKMRLVPVLRSFNMPFWFPFRSVAS